MRVVYWYCWPGTARDSLTVRVRDLAQRTALNLPTPQTYCLFHLTYAPLKQSSGARISHILSCPALASSQNEESRSRASLS